MYYIALDVFMENYQHFNNEVKAQWMTLRYAVT